MSWSLWRFVVAAVALIGANAHAETSEQIPPTPVQEYVQVWLGSSDTEDSWKLEDSNGETVQGDFSQLPLGGGVAQRLWGKRAQYGFEGGGLISWKNDDVEYAGTNNSLLVAVDTELFMMDVFMGGVISARPARWIRLYAAAGPSIAWGYLNGSDDDDEDDPDHTNIVINGPNSFVVIDGDDDSNDFSFSMYGRAGLEFIFNSGFTLGASIRYTDHEFDFDDRGELKLDEVQWLVTLGGKI